MNGFGAAKDFQLLTAPWGFEAEELSRSYLGVIHTWQGDQDTGTPLFLHEAMERRLLSVRLHKLPGEGHFSGFYFRDDTHRSTLSALFEQAGYHKARL